MRIGVRSISMLALLLGMILANCVAAQAQAPQKSFFTIHVDLSENTGLSELWQTELAKIGIDLQIHMGEWTEQAERVRGSTKRYADGGWDLWASDAVPSPLHPYVMLIEPDTYYRSLDYVDASIRKLLDAGSVASYEDSITIYKELQTKFLDSLPYIVSHYNEYPVVFSKNVKNVDIWPAYYLACPGDRPGMLSRSTYDSSGGIYNDKSDTISYGQSFTVPNFLSIFGWAFVESMYLRLLHYDVNTFELQPELAQSWDISADGKTYTFHLRDGIVWSDGVPLTADECLWTYQIQMNEEVGAENGPDLRGWIDSMEAPDNKTFIIHLKNPVGFFLNYVSGRTGMQIAPAHVLKNIAPADLRTCDYNTKPSGPVTGWFFIKEHIEGQYTKYERNEMLNTTYFNKPINKYLLFKVIPEKTTALVSAESGETDYLSLYNNYASEYTSIKDNQNLQIVNVTAVAFNYFMVNLQHPILNNVNVRKAIASVLPIKDWIAKNNYGFGLRAPTPIYPLSPYYNSSATGFTYDIEKAKAYMEAAGYNYDSLKTSEFPYVWTAVATVGALVAGLIIGFGVFKLRKK